MRTLFQGVAVLLLAAVPVIEGCGSGPFFIPVCQADGDCTTTTTTGTTGTTSTTSTTSTTATTSTTGTTTATTSTTGTTTATTSTTGSTTGVTGTTGVTETAAPTPISGTADSAAARGTAVNTGTSQAISENSILYTASAITGHVSGFSVGPGEITPLANSVTPPDGTPAAISFVPQINRLWVATDSGSIYAYTVAASGSLKLANGGKPVATVAAPASMTADHTGTLLLVASAGTPQLTVFSIDSSSGALSPVSGGAIPLDSGRPGQVFVTPDNQHVFVALGAGGVDAFTLNATAGLVANRTHIAPLQSGKNQDNALAADSASRTLYVAEAGAGIRVFTIAAAGAPAEISGSPFASQPAAPSSLYVDSASQTLYVAYPAAKLIAGYAIGSSGGLTSVSTTPFSTDSSPTALSVSAAGNYLLAVSDGGVSGMQVFSFEQATPGKLDAVTRVSAAPAE